MRIHLPTLNIFTFIVLALAAVYGGIVFGTHQPWYLEAVVIAGTFGLIFNSDYDDGLYAIPWLILAIILTVAILIGDISWFLQADNVTLSDFWKGFTDPFILE